MLKSLNNGYGCRDEPAEIVIKVDMASNPNRLAHSGMGRDVFSAMPRAKVEFVGLKQTAVAMAPSKAIRNVIVRSSRRPVAMAAKCRAR